MRGKEKKAYQPGVIGTPSVLIAVGWVSIWLLWPGVRPVARDETVASGSRVAYVRLGSAGGNWYTRPDVFGRPSWVGFRLPPAAEGMPEGAIGRRYPAALLTRADAVAAESRSAPSVEAPSFAWGGGATRYEPRWRESHVFQRRNGIKGLLKVEPRGGLRAGSVTLRAADVEHLSGYGKPWHLVLGVEVGADGGVEHVFVEAAGEDAAITAEAVRAVHRARVEGGAGRSGRIALSFGGRPTAPVSVDAGGQNP